MKLEILPGIIENLKTVQELNHKLFKKEVVDFDNTLECGWSFSQEAEDYFKKRITEDDGCVFLASVDETIVGYLAGGLNENRSYRTTTNFADVENMFIEEAYRSMGIGSKLYEAFKGWCKQKGVKRMRVIASAQNIKGIIFYKKNGFKEYDLILEKDI